MSRILVFLVLFLGLCRSLAAQQPKMGTVTGTVFDAVTGAVVRQVRVEVETQPDRSTVTDLDGRYTIDLPPGTYKLRFSAQDYHAALISEIVVTAGAIVEASTVMSNKANVTSIDVVEKVGAVATAEAMLAERKLAVSVSDSMSTEEIRKTVASDASGAIKKVTGVSIVGDGYVYVRGLGERYSATMLNNALIPTTEPERRVVPLDLFPASLIDSIKVLKTYAPDLPGEFAGGLVQMQTIEFPTTRTFNVGFSYGFNSRTTFDPFQSYGGGARDFVGFDDGTRNLPGVIPEEPRLFPGSYTQEQFQEFGRSFPVNWEPVFQDSARPVQTYSVVAGETFGRLGLVGAFTFSNRPQTYQETQRYLANAGGGQAIIFTDYPDFQLGVESPRLGAVFNASLRLNTSNKLAFRNTFTHDSDKEARRFTGLNGGIDTVIQAERLRWIERGLLSSSVEGEHAVARLGNSLFRWQFTYSKSNRDEPDLRETIREVREDGTLAFLALPQSGLRFFNSLDDQIYEPSLEWGKPFSSGRVSALFKLGFRGTFRRRDFEARRFRFLPVNVTTLDFLLPTNELLGPENIRPDGFVIRENTRGTDTYSAEMDIYGGFAMVDLSMGSKWRVAAGLRVEDASIIVTTIDPLVPGSIPSIARLQNRDPLPSVNVIYALKPRQNLRLSFGRTLSRPDFRELSPFDFTNVLGGFNTVGNPNLRRAKIDNYDLRWEWFLGGDQVVAASYFFKEFTDPIEVTIQPTTDLRQSFINAAGARNQGFELELRRGLGFIHHHLDPFSIQSNFTFVDSNVEIPDDLALLLTSKERPLIGQSRYIFNISAEWSKPQWRSSARFYLNAVSRRITNVGTFQLPDIYQERNTFLDFVYQYNIAERWNIRFTAENLGDNRYLWTQADIIQRSFRMGRTLSIGTSFSLF